MRQLLKCFVLSLVLLFLCCSTGVSEKRNLSTPCSRLIGHWKDVESGGHLYFSHVSNPTDVGIQTIVAPGKAEYTNYINKLVKSGDISNEVAEEAMKDIEEIAGKADYFQYKLKSQKPNGTEIVIIRLMKRSDFREKWYYSKYDIDKDGRKMTFKAEEFLEELWGELPGTYENVEIVYIFIDTKTSPEDK